MAGISYVDFRHMMFFDACFLVQYMFMDCGFGIDKSLRCFLSSNGREIRHDIILLENLIPWKMVDVVMKFMPVRVPLGRFVSRWKGYMQHQRKPKEEDDDDYLSTLVKHERFKPHLLGLLRYYIVGRNTGDDDTSKDKRQPKNRAVSVSANELAEIGIWLTANKTKKLIDMGLNDNGTVHGELFMSPLSLDRNRASYLFNMAALELCTVKSFTSAPVQDTAVCSYLLLLALLVCREKDVRELRARGVLQGGGGLTDKEALKFFSTFQGLRFGRSYNRVMQDIEIYKEKRQMRTKFYVFLYRHKKIIVAVCGIIVALSGIIGAFVSIKSSV